MKEKEFEVEIELVSLLTKTESLILRVVLADLIILGGGNALVVILSVKLAWDGHLNNTLIVIKLLTVPLRVDLRSTTLCFIYIFHVGHILLLLLGTSASNRQSDHILCPLRRQVIARIAPSYLLDLA